MKKQDREELKELARIKYTTTSLTAKEVAAIVGVSEVTFGKWKNGGREGNWDEIRAIYKIQPENLIKLSLEQINLIYKKANEENRTVLNSTEIDAIAKHSKTIANLRKEIDPQTIMEVLDGYLNYLSIINLLLAQQNTSFVLDYVASKIREKK